MNTACGSTRPPRPTSRRCATAASRSSSRARRARPPGECGVGRLPEPPELLAAVEASCRVGGGRRCARARHRRRDARADRRRALRGQPLAGRMGFALAEEAPRSARTSPSSPPTWRCRVTAGIDYVDVRDRRRARRGLRRALRARDVLLMAAAVADFPPVAAHGQAQEGRSGGALKLRLEPTADILAGLADRAARTRRSSASRPSTARARSTTAATSSPARASTRSSSTTSARGIGFDPPTTRSRSSPLTGEEHVPRRQGRDRRERCSTPS